ncbi:MAG: fused response regulator/phosphatase [Thermoguttaceae bacterium]|nr:fused response regulator/phosphatase [Thermoguttaceae bacterium]MDW8038796.1 fused response regulator/phosphatase [Thermoguttaceae bacterium]
MSPIQRSRILLVEDDPDDVWILRNLLGDRWDGPFELVHVELLEDALRCLETSKIDAILLDLSLPDSQGVETFLRIYAQAPEAPIVILTGLDDQALALRCVQAGAEDYLVKGQVDDELLIRSLRYAMERSRRRQAEQQLQTQTEEFRTAREIQQKLFPSSAPKLAGFDLAGALYPASATAGDYFDYIPMLDGCWGIVLGDVSGHGMGSALVMAEVRASLRALAQITSNVSEILTRTNRTLTSERQEFHFVTLTLARLDPQTRQLRYASAGQRAFLLDPAGRRSVLESTSPPLGIDPDLTVPCTEDILLAPGNIVAFFTDGLSEAESPRGGRFGIERPLELIHQHRHWPAQKIIDQLYQQVSRFIAPQPQRDDITIVLLKVL